MNRAHKSKRDESPVDSENKSKVRFQNNLIQQEQPHKKEIEHLTQLIKSCLKNEENTKKLAHLVEQAIIKKIKK